MSNSELDNLRLRIDDIDLELSKLITERQSLASKIMKAKKGDFPFDPLREEKLIKKLVSFGLDKFLVEKVWRQIISLNLSMQKKLKIGVSGNNDEIKSAYLGHFGNYFETTNYLSFVSLLASLEKQEIDIGFIDQESVKNIEKHSDIKVNFEILANVPIFKTSDQKNYNIIKLKNTN